MEILSLQPHQGVMLRRQAAHLLRRATFGPTKAMIDQFSTLTASQAVDQLFNFATTANPPIDPNTGLMFTLPLFGQPLSGINSPDFELKRFCILWWMDLMLKDGASIREKLVFFWHKHIPTIQSRIYSGTALWYQTALFRHFTKGNARELAKAVTYDNAMLVHLNLNQNISGNPQENYAREFLELFSIGKGPQDGPNSYTHYTDDDVIQGAKVLTGWDVDHTGSSRFAFNNNIASGKVRANLLGWAATHDNTVKTFSSKFNQQQIAPANPGQMSNAQDVRNEKDAFVNMVFSKQETARYLVRSLYRYFVYYEITPGIASEIIEPLSLTLFNNGYQLEPVLKTLLKSKHFFDMDPSNNPQIDISGALIKSPLDLVLGTYRLFEVHPSPYPLLALGAPMTNFYYKLHYGAFNLLPPMGMELYEPIEVAGYQAYYQGPAYNRNWITPTYLANRYKFALDFLNGFYYGGSPMYNLNLSAFVKAKFQEAEITDPDMLVAKLTELMFPSSIPVGRLQDFSVIILGTMTPADWYDEWTQFAYTGDDSGTEPVLKAIFKKMMQSPEYQLM